MKIHLTKTSGKVSVAILILLLLTAGPAFCYPEEKGISAAELLRQLGIAATIIALVGLIAVEFFLKKRLARGSYKWLLFLGLFMFPVITMVSSTTTLLDETTTVESCASCHIMHPFVNDMMDEESPTLAARHFKNKWIAKNQCYQCHTSYGVHGTAESKRDGFRHWLMYVTETWPEPITFKGSYLNSNCLTCHGETKNFRSVNSHIALREKLTKDEVSCSTCHGPVHPGPNERDQPTETAKVEEVIRIDHNLDDPEKLSAYINSLNADKQRLEQ